MWSHSLAEAAAPATLLRRFVLTPESAQFIRSLIFAIRTASFNARLHIRDHLGSQSTKPLHILRFGCIYSAALHGQFHHEHGIPSPPTFSRPSQLTMPAPASISSLRLGHSLPGRRRSILLRQTQHQRRPRTTSSTRRTATTRPRASTGYRKRTTRRQDV